MVGRGAGRKGWRMVAKKQEMAEDFKKKNKKKKSKDAAEITRKRKNDTEQVKEQKGC